MARAAFEKAGVPISEIRLAAMGSDTDRYKALIAGVVDGAIITNEFVPISAKLIASLIERAGANRILALDLHAAQIQGFFDVPVDHLFAAPVMIEYFIKVSFRSPPAISNGSREFQPAPSSCGALDWKKSRATGLFISGSTLKLWPTR